MGRAAEAVCRLSLALPAPSPQTPIRNLVGFTSGDHETSPEDLADNDLADDAEHAQQSDQGQYRDRS
jgi:hypothetical protein